MDWKKILLIAVGAMFLATPALAGNEPEFDVVGYDSNNFFNDKIKCMVVKYNEDADGEKINLYSFWRSGLLKELPNAELIPAFNIPNNAGWGEKFASASGACYPDPCYAKISRPDYKSILTDTWNPGGYDWWIILQMKPESDLDLNIRDCVLKHNAAWIYGDDAPFVAAEQTGRYRADTGQLMFIPTVNPMLTVEAHPGPFSQFSESFILDARTLPGLGITALEDAFYTSKAIWEEGVVMVMPETGQSNALGDPVYFLKQGDQIRIHIEIPLGHPADIYYGPDNVSVKYIGICGTEFSTRVFTNCPGGALGNCDDDQFMGCDENGEYGCED